MKIVLHVGMDKTGTSSIQDSLAADALTGDAQYVFLPGISQSLGALTAAAGATDPTITNDGRFKLDKTIDLAVLVASKGVFDSQLSAIQKNTAVISSEFFQFISMDKTAKIRDYLSQYGDNFTIFAYIRKAKEYAESAIQQNAKYYPFWLHGMRGSGPGYRNRFEKYFQLFGDRNILLKEFKPADFPEACVVRDFCKNLDLDVDTSRIVRSNDSISKPAVQLLSIYNKIERRPDLGHSLLLERMLKLAGPKLRLHSSLYKRLWKIDPADIDWISERTGIDMYEDITRHDDEHAIRSDKDLLDIDKETAGWLIEQAGATDKKASLVRKQPMEIALLMNRLRLKILAEGQTKSGRRPARLPST